MIPIRHDSLTFPIRTVPKTCACAECSASRTDAKRERWREPLSNDLRNKLTDEERAMPRGLQPLPNTLAFRRR